MESNGGELENPTTILWTEVYLAQHFEYLGETGRHNPGSERLLTFRLGAVLAQHWSHSI